MSSILSPVRCGVKERLLRQLRCSRSAGLRQRYLIIINLLNGSEARRRSRRDAARQETQGRGNRYSRGVGETTILLRYSGVDFQSMVLL